MERPDAGRVRRGGAVLDNEEYLEHRKTNAAFIARRSDSETADCLRTWKDGRGQTNGYIEDYANVADGLIELYQASGDVEISDRGQTLRTQ